MAFPGWRPAHVDTDGRTEQFPAEPARRQRHGDPLRRLQSSQGFFELQRLFDGLINKALDRFLAPGFQRVPAEATAETLHAGETHAVDFTIISIKNMHTDVGEHLLQFFLFS